MSNNSSNVSSKKAIIKMLSNGLRQCGKYFLQWRNNLLLKLMFFLVAWKYLYLFGNTLVIIIIGYI